MNRYVIERTVPGAGAMDQAALAAITTQSNTVLRDLGPDIQWLHSYVSDDKITCVYLATNEGLIREHGRCGGFPVDAVLQVHAMIDPSHQCGHTMTKAAISLTTGLEDPEKVTVALLVAVGAAEAGRSTLMFLTKEAVRLATRGVSVGVACDGCPSLEDLMKRYDAAGGELLICPICFNARQLDPDSMVTNARLGGTVLLWDWIGDGATTFSY